MNPIHNDETSGGTLPVAHYSYVRRTHTIVFTNLVALSSPIVGSSEKHLRQQITWNVGPRILSSITSYVFDAQRTPRLLFYPTYKDTGTRP